MATERFANDIQTTLVDPIDDSAPSIVVASFAGFPSSAQYRIRVDDELMLVTAGAGTTTWTVTRGHEGSTPAPHLAAADAVHVLTAGALGDSSDPAVDVPGLRTLGTGATQAAQGSALANKEDVANKSTDATFGANSDTLFPSQKAVKSALAAATSAGIPPTLLDAKGDLIAASAADTAARLSVGANGQVLTAASGASTGMQWATPQATVTNVKDVAYGATGDGITDDTVAIQAALNAAGNGGIVWFPKGQYKVSDQGSGFCLNISTLIGITLAGASSALVNPSGEGYGSCVFTTSTNTKIIKCESPTVGVVNQRGPKVLDLRIESRSASAMGFSLIDFNHYVFERCSFRGVGGAGSATSIGLRIEGVEDASYGRIEGCHFHRHLYGCVTVNSVGATFAGSCYFDGTGANHILLDIKGGSAISVHGAKFQCNNAAGAIGIRGGTPGGVIGGDWEFIGNNFEGCTTGINLSAPASLTVTETMVVGNSFTGSGGANPETGIVVGANRKHDQIGFNRFVNLATTITDNGTDTLQIGGRVAGALTGEYMRLGGVYVGSGTAAPTAAAVDGSLYLRSGVGAYQRTGSAWVSLGGSPALTNAANYLTTDVTMTTAGTYYDGPTLTLAAGTWLLVGSASIGAISTPVRMWTAKLWNGAATVFATQVFRTTGTSQTGRTSMSFSALVTPVTSTTFKISATSTVDGDLFQGAPTGTGGSYLNAVKIA